MPSGSCRLFSLPRAYELDTADEVEIEREASGDLHVGERLEHVRGNERDAVAGLDLDRAFEAGRSVFRASFVLLLSPLTVSSLSNVAARNV